MSSRRQELNIQLSQLGDGLIMGVMLWVCYVLRSSNFVVLDQFRSIPPFEEFYWVLVLVVTAGPLLLEGQGYYGSPLEKTVSKAIQQILRAGVWLVLLMALIALLLRLDFPSRSVAILYAVLTPVVLITKDRLIAWCQYRKLRKGRSGEPVVLVGELDEIRKFRGGLSQVQRLETQFVAVIDLTREDALDALVSAIHEYSVARVVVVVRKIGIDKIQEVVGRCETEGVEAWLSASFIQTSIARPVYDSMDRLPMLVFRTVPEHSWALYIKRGMDVLGSAAIMLVGLPLLAAITIAVKLTSPGPVIFRQMRAGLYGKPFTMLKFRTMYMDAEKRREELLARNEMSGPVFKVENDPRITPIGRLLRKLSLDETPQLWNVLRGEMSLVGPRPLPVYETEAFESFAHRRRHSMKPGLTCIWQVRGRNKVTDFNDWVKMDLEYIDNWSLALDLYLLIRTIPVVLFGWGAK